MSNAAREHDVAAGSGFKYSDELGNRRSNMIARRTILMAAGMLLVPALPALAQSPALGKNLAPAARLLGRWKGEGEGQPGQSVVERSYEAAPGGNFITARSVSTYAPQPKNPKGEVHTDISWISYDRAAKAVILRQFHLTESFVNTYSAPAEGLSGDVWVFETTAIENIPTGFKARETYTFAGADGLEEKFEVAEPGKQFDLYSLNRLRRV